MINSKKAPVGLEPGDKFETPWGSVEILDRDEENCKIHDPRTEEEVWLHFNDLIDVMKANIYRTV